MSHDIHAVRNAFSRKALRRICEMHETEFGAAFGLQKYDVIEAPPGADYFYYRDNASSVLAVAHLDTVVEHDERACRFVTTEAGQVVFSGALDDRLGAYIILDLLPKLGVTYDLLLTVGEESGQSTAQFFDTEKEYDWIIEFDRGGTDVVMYQYEDAEVRDMVKASGARVGDGAFSDISYMEHLETKAFNWGVGYQDYHGPRSHAFLEDTFRMVARYLTFSEQNEGVGMPHYPQDEPYYMGSGRYSSWGGAREWERFMAEIEEEAIEAEIIEEDFIENPSLDQINAAVAAMDGDDWPTKP